MDPCPQSCQGCRLQGNHRHTMRHRNTERHRIDFESSHVLFPQHSVHPSLTKTTISSSPFHSFVDDTTQWLPIHRSTRMIPFVSNGVRRPSVLFGIDGECACAPALVSDSSRPCSISFPASFHVLVHFIHSIIHLSIHPSP